MLPPNENVPRNASAYIIGVVNWMRPPHSVAIHEKIFTPVGTAMIIVMIMNGSCSHGAMPEVIDEGKTGFRVARGGAQEIYGIQPDLTALGKVIGGGLPIGALITGERLADVFVPGDHGSTFAGGPVIAAAAAGVAPRVASATRPRRCDGKPATFGRATLLSSVRSSWWAR